MSKTILVTGGTGFLGSHIVKRMVNENFNIIVIKRSTSSLLRLESAVHKIKFYDIDCVKLNKIFQDNIIDAIVHCATNYGRFSDSPTDIIEANILLPLQLLQIAESNHINSFINTDTILDRRINHYSLSKKQFLEWLISFSKKVVCINLSLEHFYGPFDNRSKFVTRIILDLLNQVEFIDLTLGRQKRDFIYIDDVVDAFVRLINFSFEAPKNLYYAELGTGKTIEIRELVQIVKHITGNEKTQLNFGKLPYREYEVMESNVDISMLIKLGWKPKTSLIEGLRNTIELERQHKL